MKGAMSIILLSCMVFICLGSETRNSKYYFNSDLHLFSNVYTHQDLTGTYYTIKFSAEPVEEAPATNAEARRAVVCEDDYETCDQYKEYCERNYYVKKHCLKTCGTCSKFITMHYKLLNNIEAKRINLIFYIVIYILSF